jgi:hypothetical protein
MTAEDNLSLFVAQMESLALSIKWQKGGFWSFLKFFRFSDKSVLRADTEC